MFVPRDELASSNLIVDATYVGGRAGNAADEVLPELLGLSNQGGIRYRGSVGKSLRLVALTSMFDDPDWPDHFDPESGILTYYGDNKEAGREIHTTGRRGNLVLRSIFDDAQNGPAGRARVPPIFVFRTAGTWRDLVYLGLAIPGGSELTLADDLVAVWRTKGGQRFQNYRATFTVLDAPVVDRRWIQAIREGGADMRHAPSAWADWVATGARRPLTAPRSLEHRTPREQQPRDEAGLALIERVRRHFAADPWAFEHFAGTMARLMLPDIEELEVTRRSRDGGRDAVGRMRLGRGPAGVLVDFALEAKCYSAPKSVGVKELARLISRLRHRQFGILVMTTWLDRQAYRELKADDHPVIVIAAIDIVDILRASGRGDLDVLQQWLDAEFPVHREFLGR